MDQKTFCYKDSNGNVCCFDEHGQTHSENDQPAVETQEGTKMWYHHGSLHRETGPAIEHSNGYKEYWLNNIKLTDVQIFAMTGQINFNTLTYSIY